MRNPLLVLASILLCASVLFARQSANPDPGTSYHFRIESKLSLALQQYLRRSFDVLPRHGASRGLELIVLPEEVKAFENLSRGQGWKTRLLARGRPFREIAGLDPLAPDQRYFTANEIEKEIARLAGKFPSIAKKIDLSNIPGGSKTHGNRSIFALKVSDNVGKDEDEPALLMVAEHHARELNTPVIVLKAAERLLKAYTTDPVLKRVVDSREIYFVPCVNPDGTDYVWTNDNLWRKNRRNNGGGSFGVDNNRNYPFLWGRCGSSTRTRSQTYRGPSAGSEPENKTMMALHRMIRPEIYIDFHSFGREVLSTYAPCANVNTSVQGLLKRYIDDLRAPMSYRTRRPSASGEAPEWHWSDGGSLSFLIEIGTSFQPSFTITLQEEKRVWPGIKRILTNWRPARQGHVRSIAAQKPLEAEISYSPLLFLHGEKIRSRVRDGRYGLWLPIGTHRVSFSAQGYVSQTHTVTVKNFDEGKSLDIDLVPLMTQPTLTKTGSDKIGTKTQLDLSSPADAGEIYWIAISWGTSPGIPISGNRNLPLNLDSLFILSAQNNSLLLNNVGILAASGKVSAQFPIPPIAALVNFRVYFAGIILNTSYTGLVKNFSQSLSLTIRR